MNVVVYDSGTGTLSNAGFSWPVDAPPLAEAIPSGQWKPSIGSTVCMGNFDGIHPGHERIIRRAVSIAAEENLEAIALTFPVHPMKTLGIRTVPLLTTLNEKLRVLSDLGIRTTFLLPMEGEAATFSPRRFVEDILIRILKASHCVAGFNFRFGCGRQGDIHTLATLGEEYGMDVHASRPVATDHGIISSTMLRSWVRHGDVNLVREVLGRPYTLDGTVVSGAGRGRRVGFRTANVESLEEDKLFPGPGVYWVRVNLPGCSESFPAAMSIGLNPTFPGDCEDGRFKAEVHVIDMDRNLYGTRIQVAFMQRLRPMCRYDGAADLARQIALDIKSIREGELNMEKGGENRCQVRILQATNFRYESESNPNS
ncbi:MAG: riboflavin biosynthesis protein RibF [Candidatus Wallbacteria bacterium HGW-Wallbacteria-1]|jgi:riboflavin kinase/FMN adenylyltransferase|uniref:Bifunctional riboflavin kinase/FMN adenylyltransferase n=1 Tax=Candidatus Wallbacteria bacterium HGW-Wallbacteria-1 TaxID=2013854 RepID=A0A2N1PTV8_9BACT|nr:MAG: riboflavin biosynthesis protein RibF [Candidatus Wallbacteria bacterium HGW-Wallbacteria-1]